MKRALIVICLVFLIQSVVFSQSQLNPFKLDNVEWVETEARYQSAGGSQWNDYYYNFYKLCGDTIDNGILYKKVYYGYVYNQYQPLPPGSIPTTPPSFSFYCFFRQDTITKSNYFKQAGWSQDSLLCSYNLQVGDTLKRGWYAYSSMSSTGHFPSVLRTDSIFAEGKKVKVYYTDTSQIYTPYCKNTYTGFFLVEGLGTCNGFLYGYVAPFEGWNNLDSLSYTASCNLAGISEPPIKMNLAISPNPNNGIFSIETNLSAVQTIQVFDINGQKVFTQSIAGKSQIDVRNLPDGLYNLNVTYGNSILNRRIIISK